MNSLIKTNTVKILKYISSTLLGFAIISLFIFPGSVALSSLICGSCVPYFIITGGLLFLILMFFSKVFDFYIFRKNIRSFTLNKIFGAFAIYLLINFVVYNYNKIPLSKYSIMVFLRLMIFCCLIIFINLIFSLKHKNYFFLGCIICFFVLAVFGFYGYYDNSFVVKSVCMAHGYSRTPFSYLYCTKAPLLLFLCCIPLFQKDSSRHSLLIKYKACLYFLAICFFVLNLLFSFSGKRSGYAFGIFSSVVFIITFLRFIKYTTFAKKVILLVGLAICFLFVFYKINHCVAYYDGKEFSINTFFNDRAILNLFLAKNVLPYFNSFNFVFGCGHGCNVGFFHNATVDLFFSTGIIGAGLWSFSFLYLLVIWIKSKRYDLYTTLLFLFLVITYANSWFTGFYLYFVYMYFLMYYLEYMLKNNSNNEK